MVNKSIEYEVLSIPAGDSIHFIYNNSVHAHPDIPKGYNYKETTYVTFRKKGGVMERLYEVEKIIVLDPFHKMELENLHLQSGQLERVSSYIDQRIYTYGFGKQGELYKFYILKPILELPHKPACPKMQGHTYFTVSELQSGKKIVERATKKN